MNDRRAHGMSMVLAAMLMSRTSGSHMQTAVSEAETTCRETRDSGKPFRESIFWYSLDEDRSEIADLRCAVNWKSLHAVGDTQFAYDRLVHSRKLSDGRWVRINFLDYGVTVAGVPCCSVTVRTPRPGRRRPAMLGAAVVASRESGLATRGAGS